MRDDALIDITGAGPGSCAAVGRRNEIDIASNYFLTLDMWAFRILWNSPTSDVNYSFKGCCVGLNPPSCPVVLRDGRSRPSQPMNLVLAAKNSSSA